LRIPVELLNEFILTCNAMVIVADDQDRAIRIVPVEGTVGHVGICESFSFSIILRRGSHEIGFTKFESNLVCAQSMTINDTIATL
jgi:hypothetical protein